MSFTRIPPRIFYLLLFIAGIASAQPDSVEVETHRLTLKDNSVLIGRILSENETVVRLRTGGGIDIDIPKEQIKERKVISGQIVRGEIWEEDPNRTRLLFAPTGRGLKQGEGYFSVYEIFFPFLAVGITDFITLSGGISLFPEAENQLVYLAPKITPLQLDNFDLSGGILYLRVPEQDDAAGIVYAVGTTGNMKGSITFGAGFGFAGGDFAEHPILMVGGELRGSKSVKFITENWIFVGSDVNLISIALRFFGEKLAGDFGFVIPFTTDDSTFIPWLGFAYNFGSGK